MRLCGASLMKPVPGDGFGTFARIAQNGFVARGIVSSLMAA
jgi:hypothetical protein